MAKNAELLRKRIEKKKAELITLEAQLTEIEGEKKANIFGDPVVELY